MPEKKAARKVTAAKKPAPAKPSPAPRPPAAAPTPTETCPRCGTATFGPEQRTRADGTRTVRYTILVCERGHTFAHAVTKLR